MGLPHGIPLSNGTIALWSFHRSFLSFVIKKMSSNQKEYDGVNLRAMKAATLFHFCARSSNPDIKLSYPAAMRAKGYSDLGSQDLMLLMQVRPIAEKLSPPSSSGPPVAMATAATALLSLAAPLNARKHPLATISPNIPLAAIRGYGDGDSLAGVKFWGG